jgi:glycosyltransferase involved in cell wall biosynthesis
MSKWLADSFCKDFSVDENKVFPVGAGINLPRISKPSITRQETKKILFVGKDFRRKGGHILLESFAKVRKKIKNAELIIAGPTLDDLPDGVRCEGFISKTTDEGINRLLTLYSEANIFVLPTLYEPFGIAYAEAMAHKLPCIGTNNCAIPEIIDDKKTGFLVPTNDSVTLAKSIITLLEDNELCMSMGQQGYNKYLDSYRWEIVTDKINHIMEQYL